LSSFIGHTLTSIGIATTTQRPEKPTALSVLWLGWLCFIGLAPDMDYFVPPLYALRASLEDGVRITHSVVGALFFPLLTLLVLSRLRLKQETLRLYSIQACLVGLSHIVMDLLVGVWPLPLLWPFTSHLFKLPFGILPSAPSFHLENPYMYRNVTMEVGIFVPLYAGIYVMRYTHLPRWARVTCMSVLWACSAGFMAWAYTLPR
jgi:membrane-bound metal-dependent hydrolase YbcI (DUF457 family)